jgi:fatty-acyl-CoA synthase
MDEVVATARRHALGDIPRRSAARFGTKLAIVDGDTRLTFAELDDQVERLAAGIAANGLRPGDRLVLLSRNCWQFGALAFAAARVGVVLVPVNYRLGADEVAYILRDCQAAGFICEDGFLPVANGALESAGLQGAVRAFIPLAPDSGRPGAAASGWDDLDVWFLPEGTSAPSVDVGDDDLIRIMYTSGTESRPKGAMLSSRSLMWQYVSCIVTGGMENDDIEVHAMPLYHIAQLDNFLITDVYIGASSIIVRSPDPVELMEVIERERVTNIFCPPTTWISLLRHPRFDDSDLSSLRKGYYGASPMPLEVFAEMGRRLPRLRFWNFYGQTELASLATCLGPEDQVSHPGSAGRPALNVDTRVVDERNEGVAPGVVGEIVHRSPQIALGYYRNEAATAAAFAGGWFHSGDLGFFDEDGYLYVVDRKKDMIKSGGENVATREVEEVIYAHPGVAEAAVFGMPHPTWIEAVTAVVVLRAGVSIAPEDVIAHCRARLAGYKTPKSVFIVDELPKNPSGKILKRDLRARYAESTS